MKDFIAKLSAQFSRLSSAERWFIILVIIVVFFVINFVFILPHFSDWGNLTDRMDEARSKKQRYEEAIGQSGSISNQIAKLEGENAAVPQEDQAVNFLTAIQNQAAQSGMIIMANNPLPQRTNQFFLERAQSLRTRSNEEQLVDFLYSLGSGSSLIRVRALSIQPEPSRQALNASVTLIASFQKKPVVRPQPAPAKRSETPVTSSAPQSPAKPAGAGVPARPPGAKPVTPKK